MSWQVDVYSFAMILFQLFEHTPPFAGVDPVEAAKAAALENSRPRLERLNSSQSPMPVSHESRSSPTLVKHIPLGITKLLS